MGLAGKSIFAAMAIAAFHAHAQSYPVKPIHLVIPFSSGGASLDTVARLIGTRMSEVLAQPIIVDNNANVPWKQSVYMQVWMDV